MLSRTPSSILVILLVTIACSSPPTGRPTATPTLAPADTGYVPPTPSQFDRNFNPIQHEINLEVVGLGDFLENYRYSFFLEQEASSPWDKPLLLEGILERQGWKALIAYDADNFEAPKAWVLVQLHAGPWKAVEPNVDQIRKGDIPMGITIPWDDRRYYDGIDRTFPTGDEFKEFIGGDGILTPAP